MTQTNEAIRSVDHLGVVVLPTFVGLGYGVYLLVLGGMKSTNGGILVVLGLLTLLLTPAFLKSKLALIPLYLLGAYMFSVIGCLAIGIALNERSGWSVWGIALLWIFLGWRVLSGAERLRRS